MKYNYCTLFDSHYLPKGIALYQSLLNTGVEFHLYILAFDEFTYEYLEKHRFDRITPIALGDFETKDLLELKSERSAAEYCWTCTPLLILHTIEKFNLDHCTYLDADLVFYHDPSPIHDELGNKDVLITPHRYSPQYDIEDEYGRYCVQYMVFKATPGGLEVLNWWADRCVEWCYAIPQNGKFGDQKYLDDWLERFPDYVVELNHIGGGAAPWNIQQYGLVKDESYLLKDKNSGELFSLIFYHFHSVKFYFNSVVWVSNYELEEGVLKQLYRPYVYEVMNISKDIFGVDRNKLLVPEKKEYPTFWKIFFRDLKTAIKLISGIPALKESKEGNYFKL